ncbi:MAG: hypothetical protein U5N56_06855 [Candidatus Marinimicrobia bacterium]|nr:hypothetical protein [Candidatus Neomarinimicrobiota bacterium]
MKHVQKVPYKDIKQKDKRFYFKAGEVPAGIAKTFRRLFPLPLLWQKGDCWIPVLFFRQENPELSAHIDAVTYPENSSYEEVLWDIVRTEKAALTLNIFDTAQIIGLLEKYAVNHKRGLWCERLEIGGSQWEDYRSLQNYDTDWINYFLKKHAPMKRVLVFRDKQLRQLLKSLLPLNPGINMLESIARLFKETAQRDSCEYAVYWKKAGLDTLIQNDELKPAERLSEIRMQLYRRRYPAVTEYRQRLKEEIDSLQLPGYMRIDADPCFEKPGFILRTEMEDRQAVERAAEWISKNKNKLKKIMDIQEQRENGEK